MIRIFDIQKARDILNLAELARASGIPEQRLFAKIRRGSALTTDESEAIEKALFGFGIVLNSTEAAGIRAQDIATPEI